MSPKPVSSPGGRPIHLFACLTAAATFLLVIAGGLVTSTGSALAVPDWPLSYGRLMPPMVGGIFYEHGHRMVAGTVAILILALAAWLGLRERRLWVRVLGFTALGAVVLQAILGGMTVLFLLPAPISVAHACLGQTVFCLTVVLALVTSTGWARRSGADNSPSNVDSSSPGGDLSMVGRLSVLTVGAVYIQLVLGAVMRHTGSGLAIPDFPLAFGRLLPPVWSLPIAIHFAHRVWALVVLGLGLALAIAALRGRKDRPDLALPSVLLLVLLPAQIFLGGMTVLTNKLVAPATAHVASGALILAVSLVLAIKTRRPPERVPAAPRRRPAPGAPWPATRNAPAWGDPRVP